MRWSSTYSSSTLPREIALPTITRSGRGSRFFSAYGSITGIPSVSSRSDIGGYAAASEPVTVCPCSCSIPASDAIAVPQMPIRCICFASIFIAPLDQPGFETLSAARAFQPTASSASTPNGNVTLLRDTCPERSP